MPLDPRAEAVLNQLVAIRFPRLETLTPTEVRAEIKKFFLPEENPETVGKVEERTVTGGPFPFAARIYRPQGKGPFPIFLYIHGGGWVICDLDTHDSVCRAICNEATAVVVSIDYRMAPEHKFPACIDDCYTALQWVAANAASFDGDASRIAVGGDSAGGNLAAALTLVTRDSGGPKIGFQFLIYPATDARMGSQSYVDNADGYFLTRGLMTWFWNHYKRNEDDVRDPRMSPLLEPNLAGLPDAHVITAEFDPLRDEGEEYARRLQEAGVPTTLRRYDGLFHGFFTLPQIFSESRASIQEAARAMKKALS